MPFFDFNDNKIYYNVTGSGYPLLLLHGNSVSSNMFRFDIPFFEENFKVIVFDWHGHGQSGRVARFRDDFWKYNAETANALLEHLGIEELYAIGTSGGALTGFNMLTQRNGRIKKFIADSFLGMSLTEEEAYGIAKKRTQALAHNFMTQQFWRFQHGEDWHKVVLNDINLMERLGKYNLKTVWGDLSKIDAEVLATGSYDDELLPDLELKMRTITDLIPNADLKMFEKGKHPFMITQKAEFRELAMDFFNA
jgi:pimeloyl-ACP methyl ester carboxylesterase